VLGKVCCPNCDEILKVARTHLGGRALCPGCQSIVTIREEDSAVGYDATGDTRIYKAKKAKTVVRSWLGVALILVFTVALLWWYMPREDLLISSQHYVRKLNEALASGNIQAVKDVLGAGVESPLLNAVTQYESIAMLKEEPASAEQLGTRDFVCVGREEETGREVRMIFTFKLERGKPVKLVAIRPIPEESSSTAPEAAKAEPSKTPSRREAVQDR